MNYSYKNDIVIKNWHITESKQLQLQKTYFKEHHKTFPLFLTFPAFDPVFLFLLLPVVFIHVYRCQGLIQLSFLSPILCDISLRVKMIFQFTLDCILVHWTLNVLNSTRFQDTKIRALPLFLLRFWRDVQFSNGGKYIRIHQSHLEEMILLRHLSWKRSVAC